MTFGERFWSKVNRGDPSECWEWQAARNRQDYGVFANDRFSNLAHRVAYRLVVGDFDEPCLLHTCDNPPCVNPDHLYPGDRGDNIRDAMERSDHNYGENHPSAKLSKEDVREIRERYEAGGVTHRELAEDYGVKRRQITRIINGERWEVA